MLYERNNIEQKYKWDLSKIYKDEDAFYLDYKKAQELIEDYKKHESTITSSAECLYNALSDFAKIDEIIEKLWQYASLNYAVDTSNNKYQALNAKVRNLAVLAGEVSWFVHPYIVKLDPKQVEEWYSDYPQLQSFRRMIYTHMRYKPHTLSDECELLMSKMEDCLGSHSNIRNIFSNADVRFGKIKDEEGKTVELTDTTYATYLMSGDRKVRKSAFTTLYKTYSQFINTYATTYNSLVKERCTLAKLKNFSDSLTASTFIDEVTPEIYNNLIEAVNKGLPVLYDYYKLKADVLGIDKLHLYDIYAPLIGSLERKYTYEEAVSEVLDTVGVFGEEYKENLRLGLTEKGWVDVYPSRGKRGGAFSAGCPSTEPYILLNFNGTFDNVSTLAHEAGHSMHSWFSIKYNEPHNSSYKIFVAEVASTVNELLMAHRKLRECKSVDEKLYILNELMETYRGTLFRQTMFCEFERDMHRLVEKGEPLTSEIINNYYYGLVQKYFGKDVFCDDQIKYEWARIPHFYTCFYVYKYATCISAATQIVKRIETEGEEYVKQYIEFLKCGGSKSPLDSLMVCGIDMRDPKIVDSAIEDFANCVKEFKEIYNNAKK